MNLWLIIPYLVLLVLGLLAYNWQTSVYKVEAKTEAEEKKEVPKHHDNHDDDHGHGDDDHGHGKVEKKPEKVLTTGEKIFMWILLIPLMFILIFILIPSIFPVLWSDLGGPILWEGKIFLPIIIMLFIAILLGILTNNWLYLIFIIGFCILSYFIKEENQNEEENPVVVAPPRGSTTYYFYNQDTIKLKFYGTFKFYPKGGCIEYILPSGKNFEDCPGVDAYYPPGPPGEYMFVKKNKATAVEIVR